MFALPLFPDLIDRDGSATRAWQVFKLPSTIVLDRKLGQRLAIEQELDWDSVEPRLLQDAMTGQDVDGNQQADGEEKSDGQF